MLAVAMVLSESDPVGTLDIPLVLGPTQWVRLAQAMLLTGPRPRGRTCPCPLCSAPDPEGTLGRAMFGAPTQRGTFGNFEAGPDAEGTFGISTVPRLGARLIARWWGYVWADVTIVSSLGVHGWNAESSTMSWTLATNVPTG